ncbi:MAG TPA: hypothetical protein VF483_01575, partial [Gemmatimonadaceae bacterium]
MVAAISCQDLTGPAGLRGVVGIDYKGPPPRSGDTIQATIGDTLAPPFDVTLSGITQPRARYVYSAPNNSPVIDIIANGDRIVVKGRGADTLYATLLGATVGTDSVYRAYVVVNASPKSNDIDSATVSFNALGAVKSVRAASFGANGVAVPLLPGSVVWTSDDPNVATIAKATTDTARITSVHNGSTWIRALFDNVARDSTRVTVQQTLHEYKLDTPLGIGGGGQITLSSFNDTVRVTPRAVDSLGVDLQAGSATPAPPSFLSRLPEKASVNPTTGLVTAIANTDQASPAKVLVTIPGPSGSAPVPKSDSILFVIKQVATSVTITGKRLDTIPSIGSTKALSAIMKDARGNDVQATPDWSSSNIGVVQILTVPDILARAIDTGTVFVKVSKDQVRDSIVVVVRNDPDKIKLVPDTLLIRSIDDTVGFTSATVTNTKGDPLTSGITRTWSSLNTAIATVDTAGKVAGKSVGSTSVVVSTNGKADTSLVIVTNFPAQVGITTPPPTLASIGDSTFIGTLLKNARGVTLTANNSIVSWTSSDLNVVRPRIDGSGWAYAMGPGQAIVRVTSRGDTLKVDEVIVTVSNAAANITVAPATPATLTALGQQVTFTSTVFNQAGAPITNAVVRWSVPAGGTFVSIDSITGVATALANGTATIRATSGSITKDVSLTVGQTLSTTQSTITPTAASIVATGTATTTITFQLKDANGNNLT